MILSGKGGRIPGAVNAQGITDNQVIRLAPVDMQGAGLAHLSLHHHDLGKEGQDDGRCGDGCLPLVAQHDVVLVLQRQPDLPLEHGIHQETDAGAHPPHPSYRQNAGWRRARCGPLCSAPPALGLW